MLNKIKRAWLTLEIRWQRSKLEQLAMEVADAEKALDSIHGLRRKHIEAARTLMNLKLRRSALIGDRHAAF